MKHCLNSNYFENSLIDLFDSLSSKVENIKQKERIKPVVTNSLMRQQMFSFDPHLTRAEITCLLMAAKGKTSSETAKLLGIKSSTVETHRREIKRKLSCHTIAQAVFEGILFGYLQPKSLVDSKC